MKIVFASNNKNKVTEIQKQLPNFIQIVTLEEIGHTQDIKETGKTLEENALIKANYISQKYGLPCFADDTGLEIEALNNQPGVYSARYAGEDKNSEKNIDLVLKNMATHTNRKARFKTIIALNINNKQHLFEGTIEGKITTQKKGNNGFGYDPIFIPNHSEKTFAEMSLEEKNTMSHRAKAIEKLIKFIKEIK